MQTASLILWRHAKSSWDTPALDDFDRPLGPRGLRAAPVMADHIALTLPRPDIVLCSPSVRTRETWAFLAPLYRNRMPDVRFASDIYEAPPSALFSCLSTAEDAPCVMMVGHNPGLHTLALRLLGNAPEMTCGSANLDAKFPTAAVCHLATTELASWSDAANASWSLGSFIRPKDIDPDRL